MFSRDSAFSIKKVKKNFQKPLDKSKLYAIIKLQNERTKQKMFVSFKKERKDQWHHKG